MIDGTQRFLWQVACALALCAAPGAAFAQATGVAGSIERSAATTPQEKIAFATEATQTISNVVDRINRMLALAVREGAQADIRCLTPLHTSARSLLAVSESSKAEMMAQLEAGNADRATSEFTIIAIGQDRAAGLLAEAERCRGGGSTTLDGTTTLTVLGGEVGSASDTENPEYPPEFDVDFDPPDQSPFF